MRLNFKIRFKIETAICSRNDFVIAQTLQVTQIVK